MIDALADTQHMLAFIAHMAPMHFQLCCNTSELVEWIKNN